MSRGAEGAEDAPGITAAEILAEAERERVVLAARLAELEARPRLEPHLVERENGLLELEPHPDAAATYAEIEAVERALEDVDERIAWSRSEAEEAETRERERRAAILAAKADTDRRLTPNVPEQRERMKEIYQAIGACWSSTKIAVVFAEKWGCTTRHVQRMLRRAFAELQDEDADAKTNRRNRLRLAVEEHYAKCLAAKEYTAAGSDLDRLARIDGCYVDKIEMTGAGGAPLQVSVSTALDDLARAVAHVRERTTGAIAESGEVLDMLDAPAIADPT